MLKASYTRLRYWDLSDKQIKKITSLEEKHQTEMDKYHHFDLAYNYSAEEEFGDTSIAMVLYLLESYEQMVHTSFIWWVATSLTDFVRGRIGIISNWTVERLSDDLFSFPTRTLGTRIIT